MDRNKRTRSGLLLRAGLTILAMLGSGACTLAQSAHQSPADVEKQVEALLSKMTVEEKIR
jgi:hypothetical protein